MDFSNILVLFCVFEFYQIPNRRQIDGFTDILGLLLATSNSCEFNLAHCNKFKGIKNYHQIEGNSSKLNLNLWAIGIGILLALVRIYKKNLLQHWL